MTNYGVNFMLVSWSFPTEPAMPFSGILPCRECFEATCEVTKEPRTPVTFMPFCKLVTITKDKLWFKFHIGVLILSHWTSCATFTHFTISQVLRSNERGIQMVTERPRKLVRPIIFCRLTALTNFMSSDMLIRSFFFVLPKLILMWMQSWIFLPSSHVKNAKTSTVSLQVSLHVKT